MSDKTESPKAMPKSAIYKDLAGRAGLEPKQVGAVFEALEDLIKEQLGKKGPGLFTIRTAGRSRPRKKPAGKAGTRVIAGVERQVAAKPASTVVKAITLKSRKELSK